MADKTKILIVCIHNSARSQMAEAFFKELGSEWFEVESAGFEPGTLNPLAVEAMKDIGIDISNNSVDSVFDYYKNGKSYDFVITVCDESNAQKCPLFPGVIKRVHWSFTDPSGLSGSDDEKLNATKGIRDEIKEKVEAFIDVMKILY